MPGINKQTNVVLALVLLGFAGCLATKCVSINNQPCMARPMFFDVNPDELLYYPFIISLGRGDESCNTVIW